MTKKLEFKVGFTENRGPLAKVVATEEVESIGAYGGRPGGKEVWITMDYGKTKGLYVRIQDLDIARKLYERIGELLEYYDSPEFDSE